MSIKTKNGKVKMSNGLKKNEKEGEKSITDLGIKTSIRWHIQKQNKLLLL